jgi:dehydrogenase/reductase SDR family member 7B
MKPFTDKVVVITGASSGIGKALALEFAAGGAHIVGAARTAEKLDELNQQLAAMNVQTLMATTDVSIESDCKHLIDETIRRFGKIDVMINNAGISMRALFEEVNLDVLRKSMDINFWGTVYCSRFALPHLLKSKGSLVGVSSIAGYKGLPGRSGYSASKFAMQGLLEVIRIENLKKGLHVLIACPGFTTSNIRKTALAADGSQQGESPRNEEKMMSAEEVATKIAKAVEKRRRTLVLTSQGKMTVLLNKFVPRFLDKMVYNHIAKEPNSPFK